MNDEKKIAFEPFGKPLDQAKCLVVWGHGWGRDRNAFKPFAEALSGRAAHMLVDFPGFGASPAPPLEWGTAEVADALAEIVRPYRNVKKIIYVGHSYGGRIGIQMASRHPDLVDGLFLIASAGLPRNRSLLKKLVMAIRVDVFKTLKYLAPLLGVSVEALRSKFGSPDYRSAGAMRAVFVKIISENLSEEARRIKCPVRLIYGTSDTETPPEIGERLEKLIPHAKLTLLDEQDHYSLLGEGRHVVIKRLADFMGEPK